MDLTELASNVAASGKRFVGRAARIEVSDEKAFLHAHPGATIAFITAGSGVLKSDTGEQRVRAGDTIYIPPNTAHLSIADEHTTMTEWIVYLGAEDDRQVLLEV